MFSYKKVGGLHHVKLGRLGFSFYVKKSSKKKVHNARVLGPQLRSVERDGRRVFVVA